MAIAVVAVHRDGGPGGCLRPLNTCRRFQNDRQHGDHGKLNVGKGTRYDATNTENLLLLAINNQVLFDQKVDHLQLFNTLGTSSGVGNVRQPLNRM